MENFEIILSVFLGIGLAAAVGFRVFLPLLVLSLAGYYDIIPLNESWHWVGSLTAVITMGVATLIEIFGYYIPWFDNLLDTIALPLATLAGTAVMVATISDLSPVVTWALAIIAGGGTAQLGSLPAQQRVVWQIQYSPLWKQELPLLWPLLLSLFPL